MSTEEPTTSPQEPERELSATQMGYFGILAETVGVLLAVFVGLRFLIAEARPDSVAWVSFGIGAVLLADMVRRIIRGQNRNSAE